MEDKIDKENVEVIVIPTTTRKCEKRSPDHLESVIRSLA
jgi:hypothetical protein